MVERSHRSHAPQRCPAAGRVCSPPKCSSTATLKERRRAIARRGLVAGVPCRGHHCTKLAVAAKLPVDICSTDRALPRALSGDHPVRSPLVAVVVLAGALVACSRSEAPDQDAVTQVNPPAAATAPASGCDLVTAAEMSTLLGTAVVGRQPYGDDTCVYTPPQDSAPQVELKVSLGDGEPAMLASRFMSRFEPELTESLAGIGDEATLAGPALMVRLGQDLVTITFTAIEEPVPVARGIIDIMRPRMGESARASNTAAGKSLPQGEIEDLLETFLGGKTGDEGGPGAGVEVADPPAELAARLERIPSLNGPCASGGDSSAAEIAASAAAQIPLIVGMTLTHTWMAEAEEGDHECLYQVTAVDAEGVGTTMSCAEHAGEQAVVAQRRVCRVDLRDGLLYQTRYSRASPTAIDGATMFSLSRRQFDELTADEGQTWQRYLEIDARSTRQDATFDVLQDRRGIIRLAGRGTRAIIVNDEPRELPVLHVEGMLAPPLGSRNGRPVRATVLDDARFPLVLDYVFPDSDFAIRHWKITYPDPDTLEHRLQHDRRVDVYGIYFDTASAEIRPESEPILQEIADVVRRHSDWTLRIDGHTDSIGSTERNLDLSRRRAASVRSALVERFGLPADRLTTGGYGEAAPKDTNDTPEGRARNRRVELVRQ